MQIHELNTDAINIADLQDLQAYQYTSFLKSQSKLNEVGAMNTKKLRAKFIEMFGYGLQLEAELNILRKFTYKTLKNLIEKDTEIQDYQLCIDELDKQIEELEK